MGPRSQASDSLVLAFGGKDARKRCGGHGMTGVHAATLQATAPCGSVSGEFTGGPPCESGGEQGTLGLGVTVVEEDQAPVFHAPQHHPWGEDDIQFGKPIGRRKVLLKQLQAWGRSGLGAIGDADWAIGAGPGSARRKGTDWVCLH